jgi:hypothetical protein
MKTILIIDDIINKKYLKNKYIDIFLLNSTKKNIERLSNEIYGCTHSTIIAQILERNVKVTFKIINIALKCDVERKIDIEDLSVALEIGLDYDVNVINLSIGSRKLSDIKYLKKVIEEINNRKIPLICSISNSMDMTIPASLDCCIGVANDFDNIYPPQKILKVEENILGIDYVVNSAKLLKNEFYKPSNSYSAAFISAAYLNSELFKDKNKIRFNARKKENNHIPKIIFINFDEYLKIINIFIEKHNIEAIGILIDMQKVLLFSVNEIKYYSTEEVEDIIKTIICDIVLIFSDKNKIKISSNDLIVTKNKDNIILKDCKGSIEHIQGDLQEMVEILIKKV